LALVLGSGLFRFFQEERSAKVLDHLSELVETTTAVNRDGESQEVPLEEVVVGDVISAWPSATWSRPMPGSSRPKTSSSANRL
jgi:magnesium-transporting ATPase (P-type)